jgi:hypothetical protein
MKYSYLLSVTLVALSSLHSIPPTPDPVVTMIRPRSQELNRPLQIVGTCESTHKIDRGPFYATLSASGFYSKTFKPGKMAAALFGNALQCSSNDPYLHIQGSSYLATNRDAQALLADYFYLPRDYDGKLFFKPTIQNAGADIDLYFGLNEVREGMYLRIHSSLVNTKWNLHMRECIATPGVLGYPAGYFTANLLTSAQLLSSFSQYGCGQSPLGGTITQNTSAIATGAATNTTSANITTLLYGLDYSKICCSQSKTQLADIRFEVGRILKETDNYHIGVDAQLVIPTGTKIKSHHLFESTIGNGHHWELGGGVHGHYMFYDSEEKEAHASIYSDIVITHLFSTHQKRSFDLKGNPLSRYMLASKFTTPNGTFSAGPNNIVPSAQFAQAYAPLANITTLDVGVSVGVQIDFTALVHYCKKQWDFDFGYNLWYRSKEHIDRKISHNSCFPPVCDPSQTNKWALKGDARMYGFHINNDIARFEGVIPLSATESNATIYQGTNESLFNCSATDVNGAIDNPQIATALPTSPATDGIYACPFNVNATVPDVDPINTSLEPIFIDCCDLDLRGVKSLSQKIFAHSSYNWSWRDTTPCIGIGASAEFGTSNGKKNCNAKITPNTVTFTDKVLSFAPSQWEIWLKAGITFD